MSHSMPIRGTKCKLKYSVRKYSSKILSSRPKPALISRHHHQTFLYKLSVRVCLHAPRLTLAINPTCKLNDTIDRNNYNYHMRSRGFHCFFFKCRVFRISLRALRTNFYSSSYSRFTHLHMGVMHVLLLLVGYPLKLANSLLQFILNSPNPKGR